MSEHFLPDWRCASVGLPDVVAERQGITTRVREGTWRDWESPTDDGAPHPSYRLLIDTVNGRIIGGTLYGNQASMCIDELRELIGKEIGDDVPASGPITAEVHLNKSGLH